MHFTIFLVFSLHWEGQNELKLANFRDVRRRNGTEPL